MIATPPTNRNGFTLIETIVVLVILGLALIIAAGFLPHRNTTLELSSATEQVTGALRLARSKALTESRPIPFAVTPGGHGFRIDKATTTLGSAVIEAHPAALIFAPDGSATAGVVSVSIGDRQRVISIDWFTGRVTVAP